MRVDLRLEKIEFGGQSLVLNVLLACFELEPIYTESHHAEKDDDEEICRDHLDHVTSCVEIPVAACKSVNQISTEHQANRDQDGKGQAELQQITTELAVFEERGEKYEVVNIPDDHGKDHLDGYHRRNRAPVNVSIALVRDDLVEEERNVYTPERQVKKYHAVPGN